jgi:hypothetical protein
MEDDRDFEIARLRDSLEKIAWLRLPIEAARWDAKEAAEGHFLMFDKCRKIADEALTGPKRELRPWRTRRT